ncbi:hypothetical protein Aph01nite_01010 [Acrocarpospora phusangensis]|uniref:Carrier domain-containing protein n=1 Tax=Acrocarpospora phusangensis TaxID=1070424 RepID=A0A919Q452_9ACTN|nr:condensation domain-containing protein [Acrocarpospora phusangensis]GIH21791.1 hypothetical protein Aph01nite_01010 [Acrocarpospora phusangensis]
MPHTPASPLQRGMWINELAGSGAAYQMPLAITFEGPLDVPALLAACASVLERHELLGSAFQEGDGELRVVRASDPPTVTYGPEQPPDFDVRYGPLARFTLTETGPDRHRLLFIAHHLVFDGMSKDILVRDLADAYAGRPTRPAAPPYGEAIQAEAQRVEEALPAAETFWKSRWRDQFEVYTPAGQITASRRPGPGGSVAALSGLPDAGDLGVTTFERVLAALHALLHRYGAREPIISVDLSTRGGDTAETVGLLVNELPVVCRPEPGGTFRELAHQVREELRAVYAFREVPLARALGGLSPRGSLTPVSVSYRRRGPDPGFPGLAVTVDWAMFNGGARGALHLQAIEGAGGPGTLEAWLRHDPRVVSGEDAALIATDLRAVLSQPPDTPLADLVLPSAGARAAQAVAPAPAAAIATAPPEIVEAVTRIWCDVLRLKHVGPHEDLFDLGGHSISIINIIARIGKQYDVELPMDVFFDNPTVVGVAEAVAQASRDAGA